MKKLTIQAIAQAANVSCATVSRCLTGSEGVGEKTRQRVLQLCRELGYNTNYTEAAPQRSGRIGLLCPMLSDPVTAALAQELERYLGSLGCGLVLCQSFGNRQQEIDALQRLRAQRVDGVIIIPTGRDSRKLLRAQDSPLEGVFLNAHLADQPESYVAVDHFLGGQAALRHLYDRGHRQILFVGSADCEIHRKRRSGYESACRQLRLEAVCMEPKELHQADWRRFTAVITADCQAALAVPRDKHLVSFDGQAFSRAGILLDTFDCPENMARIAADILLEKLDRPVGGYSHRMVVPQLRQRSQEIQNEEAAHG